MFNTMLAYKMLETIKLINSISAYCLIVLAVTGVLGNAVVIFGITRMCKRATGAYSFHLNHFQLLITLNV